MKFNSINNIKRGSYSHVICNVIVVIPIMSPNNFMWPFILSLLSEVSGEVYATKSNSEFYYEAFTDRQAQFGPNLLGAVKGMLIKAEPPNGCDKSLKPPPNITNDVGKWILLVPRYTTYLNCSFEMKIRRAQAAGYDAVIVYNINSEELLPMSAKNGTGIVIPSVFVGYTAGGKLTRNYTGPDYFVIITGESPFNVQTHLLIPFAIVVGICFIVMIVFMIVKFIKDRRRQRRHRLPTSTLNKIPTCKFHKGDPYETCAICLDDYIEGEKLRILPCNHAYHSKCIDPWLTKNKRVCPICKRKVFANNEPHLDSDSESEADDTTPLINPLHRGTQGGTFENQSGNHLQRAARSISQQSGAATFVTASDRHSINGDYESLSSNSGSAMGLNINNTEDNDECDNLEVHVHNSDVENHFSRSDINV